MKAVLFDLDDTLHDKSSTLSLMAARQYESFELNSLGVDEAAWREHYLRLHSINMPKTEVFARLAAECSLPESMPEDMLTEFDRDCGGQAQPFPGMQELLATCRDAGLVLGCVTNGRDHMQRSKLDGLGVTDLFDSIVTSGGFGAKKPDPSIFDRCLSELEVQRMDAFFVGDNFDADMRPAIDLGMHAIWKSSRGHESVPFASDSLHEIRAYLCDLIQG